MEHRRGTPCAARVTGATALFESAGLAALGGLSGAPGLLCFDLDGTLAPIVAQRQDAVVPASIAALMQALTQRWRVAVVTGRTIDDAAPRLGFTPHWLWGCHGAQRPRSGSGLDGEAEVFDTPDPLALHRALDRCRAQLSGHAEALLARRVEVEDKGLTIALHYRHAAAADTVAAWLDTLLVPVVLVTEASGLPPGLHAEHGHCVLNLSASAAPDKGDALLDLLALCGTDRALVIGDDANDEPAFVKAPPDCVSIRIAPVSTPTRARFRIPAQAQVEALLQLLLNLRH